MTEHLDRNEFIREQYRQYFQVYRNHVGLAWKIPSIAIISVLLVFQIDLKKLELLHKLPGLSAFGFFVLSVFLLALYNLSERNLRYVKHYTDLLSRLEKTHGLELNSLHMEIRKGFKGLLQIPSSKIFSVLVLCLCLASFALSVYFSVLVISQ